MPLPLACARPPSRSCPGCNCCEGERHRAGCPMLPEPGPCLGEFWDDWILFGPVPDLGLALDEHMALRAAELGVVSAHGGFDIGRSRDFGRGFSYVRFLMRDKENDDGKA